MACYFLFLYFILLLRDTADIVHYTTIVYVERETIASWQIGQEHVMFEYGKVVVNISSKSFPARNMHDKIGRLTSEICYHVESFHAQEH